MDRQYPDRTPLPPGYTVEWWEETEQYHWVGPDVSDYSDGHVNHWACWRGAWAHYRAALPLHPEPQEEK